MIDTGYQHIDDDALPLLAKVNWLTPAKIMEMDELDIVTALYYRWIDERHELTEKGKSDYEAMVFCGRIKLRKKRGNKNATQQDKT